MNNEPKDDPSARMRKLTGSSSPLMRLPKRLDASTESNLSEEIDGQVPDAAGQESAHQTPPTPAPASKFKGFKLKASGKKLELAPAFWMIASVFSLFVNVVMLIVVFVLLINYRNIRIDNYMNVGESLLGGLYTNFEKMDRAHIISNIPVESEIPVKFDLQLNQQTTVVLSEDVTIRNALVTVNTGGLNITRANTTIVLPQGTSLPIVLNLTVPVDTKVPVVLNVPVDIPLKDTQLHEPFSGLQDVVRPFYCMIDPNVVNLDGQPICK